MLNKGFYVRERIELKFYLTDIIKQKKKDFSIERMSILFEIQKLLKQGFLHLMILKVFQS